jgi:acyl-CoA synthetase (AMP-forming)/AMP-acid ligase II
MVATVPPPSPSAENDILSYLLGHALQSPDKTFVQAELPDSRDKIGYARAWRDLNRCKAEYVRQGVRPGGVVLIFLPQGWTAIAHYLGAIAHGCIASFMPCPSAKQDPDKYWAAHQKLIERIEPAALVTNDAHAEQMRRNGLVQGQTVLMDAKAPDLLPDGKSGAWSPAAPDATPILQHSSGTTGLKKGVMLSHRAILDQTFSYARSIDARADEVVVSWLPLYHDMGLVACLLMPMIVGQTIVLMDPFHWVSRPGTLFEAIARHRGTLCWLPNFAFDHLARIVEPKPETMSLASMRAFVNCSEPCHAASFRRFAEKFAPLGLADTALQVCYAMAETTFAITQTPVSAKPLTIHVDRVLLHEEGRVALPVSSDTDQELISTGRPIRGTDIVVLDGNRQPVADGTVGEVNVRSSCLFSGYYKLPEETAARLHGDLYATRDRGFIRDGELFVLGRLDDLIIVAGRNFHATEIETVLNRVDGLKPGRNVAFGVANTERGTSDLIVVAETSDDAGADVSTPEHKALRHQVREQVFQSLSIYPSEVRLVTQGWLLKTTSGKIERNGNAAKFTREKRDNASRRASA